MATEKLIKNPFEWGAYRLVDLVRAMGRGVHSLRMPEEQVDLPSVQRIGLDDIRGAIASGVEDLGRFRTDALAVTLIYPLVGIVLAVAASTLNLIPLIFPLVSGFALIGPIAGLGLYALSRRHEMEEAGEKEAETPRAYGPMAVVGLLLLAIFVAWLVVAYWIFLETLGGEAPQSIAAFIRDVFMTEAGWTMIVTGVGVGFLFALVAFSIGVISFPLMLDRPVGPVTAMRTSVRAVIKNPGPMAAWGAIVTAGLVIGSVPALIGLVIVIPLLGHSTWHLYRRLVQRQGTVPGRRAPGPNRAHRRASQKAVTGKA